QLEPEVDVDRFTASVLYNRRIGAASWQTTATWGRNRKPGENQDGFLLESAWWSGGRHTVFARAEWVEKDELFVEEPLAGVVFDVGKLSAGYLYELVRVRRLSFGVGGLASVYHVPRALEPAYGGGPVSFMLFVRGAVR